MKRDENIGGSTESSVTTINKKSEGKGGKQQNCHPFFSKPVARKRKNEDDTQRNSQDMIDAVLKVPVKQAKDGKTAKKDNKFKHKWLLDERFQVDRTPISNAWFT